MAYFIHGTAAASHGGVGIDPATAAIGHGKSNVMHSLMLLAQLASWLSDRQWTALRRLLWQRKP